MTRFLTSGVQSLSILITGVAMAFVLGACGSGDSSSGVDGTASGSGILAVQLTDAHTDSVSQVNVHIVGLMVKRSNAPVETLGFAGRTVELLALENTTELMIEAEVPAGSYEFIQVELDESLSNVVENGDTKPLQIPSEEIKVLGGFEVEADGATTVLLDFDAEESLMKRGDGQWLLRPVILLANVTMS